MANFNPFRYRGYYFDTDTGLYYLQSRYYDPTTGRFLNADIVFDYDAGFPGYNLFVYCGNEPILRIDCSGADSNKMDDGELTDDEMDSWGSGGGGPLVGGPGTSSGFAYAYNPMDAGYTHHIDLSIASNSSSFTGGILTNGYASFSSYSKPIATSTNGKISKKSVAMYTNDALDAAIEFLGPGYSEKSNDRFVSADGIRQVWLGHNDLLGRHAGAPHINLGYIGDGKYSFHIYFFD